MFSKFFINRPIFATVLALIIVVAGLVTLNILPVAQFPDITPPTVQVSAVYPGANAETVAQTVGIPIEQQVNGVDGMLYMSSTSSSSGAYSLTITFAVGTDVDMATVQQGKCSTIITTGTCCCTRCNRTKAIIKHRHVPHHECQRLGV